MLIISTLIFTCFTLSAQTHLQPTADQVKNENLCPVSTILNSSFSGLMSYPAEIFHDNRLQSKRDERTYLCNYQRQNYTCQMTPFCPLISGNAKRVMKFCPAERRNMNAICKLRCLKVNENERSGKVNIIVFGGSMTWGLGSYGCCCYRDPTQCPSSYSCPRAADPYDDGNRYCSWASHFGRWIKNYFNNHNLLFFNLATRASTSYYTANIIGNYLSENNIQLSNNDIILLDFSINDAESQSIMMIRHGVESLIRKLYYYSNGSYPTIILLETWPHMIGSHESPEFIILNNFEPNPHKNDYITIYREVLLLSFII